MDNVHKIATGEAFIRRGATVAMVVDQYGDERIIHAQKGSRDLRIKKLRTTPIEAYNRIISSFISAKIKDLRLAKGWTLEQLAVKAKLNPATKVRMYEIEANTRRQCIRMGTLYAIAEALEVDPSVLMPTKTFVFSVYDQENSKSL